MCGIAGKLNPSGEPVSPAEIHAMCNTIVHRGPDDEGIYVSGPVGLGMRRLSIIDLSGGKQPIHNEDRSVWVVLNGEIYNFPQLRSELESRGHCFYTRSDTEVIVHLYEEHGSACVEKLRGMFAFALYDERKQQLLLVRDRLGKKPLYYSACSNGSLLFGSEIKALLTADPELNKPDLGALLNYFCFGYVPDPASAFQPIRKLPPGHLLEFCQGSIRVERYWDLTRFGLYSPASEEECLEELEALLSDSVKMRLISDVPLGAFLSGGVDSSLVVAMMARHSSRPVKTFSIGFTSPDFDESGYARLLAQRFETEHCELTLEPDFEELLPQLLASMDEPFADSSLLPTYYVAQLARRHVTVALSGDGGDELFAGYDRYGIALRRRRFDWAPQWMGRLFRDHLYATLPNSLKGSRFLYNASLPDGLRYVDSVSYVSAQQRDRALFSEEFLAQIRALEAPSAGFASHLESISGADGLSRLQYLDIKTYLPGDVLTKVDRMSMAVSLEVRCPLLDHVWVEHAAALKPEWKLRMGEPKYILKKLAERMGVPPELLYRPKQGFAVPLVHWMRNQLRRDLLQLLLEPQTIQRGYFNREAVARVIHEHTTGRRDHSGSLWVLLVFELWQRQFRHSRQSGERPAELFAGQGKA
jgi:asparagine synthase (glutamine-hydrolysing)